MHPINDAEAFLSVDTLAAEAQCEASSIISSTASAIVSTDRNASASFIGCKSVEEYEIREAALEKDYSKYKSLYKINDFEIPVKKISNDDKTVNAKTSLLLKNSLISIGLKGSFSSDGRIEP